MSNLLTPSTGDEYAPDIPTLIERVRELRPFLQEHAEQAERERNIPPAVMQKLQDIGVFRVSLPPKYGGMPAGVCDRLDIVREVAQGDGGAGWITTIVLGNNWVMGHFSNEAQDEVFGADPHAKVSAVIPVSGRGDRVEGGYRVSGKWGYNSGLSYTNWVLVAAAMHDENGEFVDTAQLLLPRTDVTEEDTWYVAGLASSGSNTVVADDVFVPEHRVLYHSPTMQGHHAAEGEPTFRASFVSALSTWLLGPQLGIAEAVYDRVVAKASSKGIAYTRYERQADSVASQMRVARARVELDAALGLARATAQELDRFAEANEMPDYTYRTGVRARTGWIVEQLTAAVDSLISVHGSAAFALSNPLQRNWRDLNTAARHALILPDVGYELYGRALLGEPGEPASPLS